MTSAIDATKPTAVQALTADVRANFLIAKNEITALQTVANASALKADLAAPTGAALIGFTQAGAGTIARTLQDRADRKSVV